jgi:lipopolysaccharide transport system permease protein
MNQSPHQIVRHYSPQPLLSHPGAMFREMFADLWVGRELAWRLFLRDVSAQYRQSYLGYVWAFLPPLISSLTFVFLNSQGLFSSGKTGLPYAAFAMIGTLLWQVFVDALNAPVNALQSSKSMLAKINFPRESVLVAGIAMVLFNFLVRLVLLVGVLFFFHVEPDTGLLFFPLAVLGLIILGTACGLAVAPLGALYGDIGRAIPLITSFWMLLTPVVYPARKTGLAGWLATWNPVSPLIMVARNSLTGEHLAPLAPFFGVFMASLLILLVGWIGFRIAMPHLIARMGG